MAESNRAPMELRVLQLENERRAEEEREALSGALGELAAAAALDPAMAPGVTGRGLAQIESAMEAEMLDAAEAAAMQAEFADNVHMSAMRGQIATAPEDMKTRLESGEFDDIFDPPARDQLLGEARTTARVKQAGASAAARARRRGLEIDMKEHLATLGETGAGDESVAARALAELPEIEYAAFKQGQARSRERHATRAEYAFMTQAGIEADIAAKAPGGGPRDGDERDAAHAIRTAIRDEVLTARATDPAGWAMRDATVMQSIEDAAAALEQAEAKVELDPGRENLNALESAEKAYRRALAGRDRMQRDMGVEPKLLSQAELDGIAGKLAGKTPVEQRAMLHRLWKCLGGEYGRLVEELGGEIDADTALLAKNAMYPRYAELLAKGMEKTRANGPARPKGAVVANLPFIGDDGTDPITGKKNPPVKFDYGSLGTRCQDQQVFALPNGSYVMYDGDALVPAVLEQGDRPALAPDVNPHAEEAVEATVRPQVGGTAPGRRPYYPITGENGVSFLPLDVAGTDPDPDPAAGQQKEIDSLSGEIAREKEVLARTDAATPERRAQIKARKAEIAEKESRLHELEVERDGIRAEHEAEFGDSARQHAWPVPLREDGFVDEDILREEFGIEVDDGTYFVWDAESSTFHEARWLDEPDAQGRYFEPLHDVEPLQPFDDSGTMRSTDEIEAEARALAERAGKGLDRAAAIAELAKLVEANGRDYESLLAKDPNGEKQATRNAKIIHEKGLAEL